MDRLHRVVLTLIDLRRSTAVGDSPRVNPDVHKSPMLHTDHGGGGALHDYDWVTPARQGSTFAAIPSVEARGRVDHAIAVRHSYSLRSLPTMVIRQSFLIKKVSKNKADSFRSVIFTNPSLCSGKTETFVKTPASLIWCTNY